MRVAIAVFVAVALASCASNAPPPPQQPAAPMTPDERCAAGVKALGNPYVTPAQQAVVIESMRNQGCMGKPQ